MKLLEYRGKLAAGLHPSTNLLLACWFTLTAVHAIHVAAGVGLNLWLAARSGRMAPAQRAERLRAARLYWLFVDSVWIVILFAFYAFQLAVVTRWHGPLSRVPDLLRSRPAR